MSSPPDKEEKSEATALVNCIKEMKPLSKEEQARLLRTLATHFDLRIPSFMPPRVVGPGGVRYGTPFE